MGKTAVAAAGAAYLRRIRGSRESRQATWFYVAHLSSYVLPLIAFTYLARVTGPAEWGRLSVFHSLGLYASQVVEYGFNFTAARDVARDRDDPGARRSILADVHAAKVVLACLLLVGAAAAYAFLPQFLRSPLLFGAALMYAVAQGSTLVWYFQGVGRIGEFAVLDAASRAVAAIATIAVVQTPDDGWRMIALNAAGCFTTTALGLLMIRRDTPVGLSSATRALGTLKAAFPLFVFRGASSLYGAANGLILGMLATPTSVGYYTGAERAYKGFTALLHPLMQLLYAKVNYAMGRGAREFEGQSLQVARRLGAMMAASGAMLGLVCLATAPLVVAILLGKGFDAAVPVLRIFGAVLFMEAVGIALGVQWMLPLGLDKQFTAITVVAGLTNVALAWWLAGSYGEVGMVLAVLASHVTTAVGCFACLRLRGQDPFRRTESK